MVAALSRAFPDASRCLSRNSPGIGRIGKKIVYDANGLNGSLLRPCHESHQDRSFEWETEEVGYIELWY